MVPSHVSSVRSPVSNVDMCSGHGVHCPCPTRPLNVPRSQGTQEGILSITVEWYPAEQLTRNVLKCRQSNTHRILLCLS